MSRLGTGRPAIALIITLLVAPAACSDAVGPDPEPEDGPARIAFARLTIGPYTDLIRTVARGSDATIILPPGTAAVTITAEWLDAAGRTIAGFSPAELELLVTGPAFTVTPGTFSGTIRGLVLGSNSLEVLAWHPQEARVGFGARLYLVVEESDGEVDPCNGCWDY